jgi:hypothetical protein
MALENEQLDEVLWRDTHPRLPFPTEDALYEMVKAIP